MTEPTRAEDKGPKNTDRIIAALDVETEVEAREIVSELKGRVGAFKIGSQLFTAAGPGFVRELTGAGIKIFLDLKFHDIPNTVAAAAVEAARLGVWMFNIHTIGGSEMMKRVVKDMGEVCERGSIARPLIIGVTVLTSADSETLVEVGIDGNVEAFVARLARLADECGLDGVVASAREVPLVRHAVSRPGFLTVTPGIRGAFATDDDQKRVTTFGQAMAHGSDYVVIGRPIVQAKDRAAAVEQIVGAF
jgi:orotidine-5'-phosphate decarboxylase